MNIQKFKKLKLFKNNASGQTLFVKPSKSLLDQNVSFDFDQYSLKEINRIASKTDFSITDPLKLNVDDTELSRCLLDRKTIPILYGHGCDEHHFKSLSFGFFETDNGNKNTEKFIFIYASNETDIMDIEDDLDKPISGMSRQTTIDILNAFLSSRAGVNYKIFQRSR